MYFFAIMGVWKVLGAIAILVPRFSAAQGVGVCRHLLRLDRRGASCAAVGGYGAYGFHVIAPLIVAGFTVASWALRPDSRKIGVLFPAKA